MEIQCHGQRETPAAQLNSKPVRRIGLPYTVPLLTIDQLSPKKKASKPILMWNENPETVCNVIRIHIQYDGRIYWHRMVQVFRRAVPASVHVQICTVRRLFFFAFHFNLQIGQFVVISSDRL